MKILAKRRAFYNGEIIRIGQEIEYDNKNIPSWAVEVKKSTKSKNTSSSKYFQTQLPLGDIDKTNLDNISLNNQKTLEKENADAQLLNELDEYITKGAEKEILLDSVENKTIKQQIEELKSKLKGV